MRKIILSCMLFVGMLALHAQVVTLTPSQHIQEQKQLGATFEPVSLFSTITLKQVAVAIPPELKDYSLLDINSSKLQSLKKNNPQTLELKIPTGSTSVLLELVKVDIRTDDFQVVEMPSAIVLETDKTVTHYRGIIKGEPNSLVALSFLGDQVSAIVSSGKDNGNFVIAQLENSKSHIYYNDNDLNHLNDFVCSTADNDESYTPEQLGNNNTFKAANSCPEIFFDISNDIVSNKGGTRNASNFLEAVFNQVAVLYANERVNVKISGIKAWTSKPPFNNDLNSYRTYRNNNNFNGDVGHLVTYNYSGGVAYLNAICGAYRYGISGIRSNYSNVPTYSWTVMVISHELGHNFGSSHTQACKWNGNNTAIDGCVDTEGGCAKPGIPSGGGTIMSYCHLTSAGINFTKGFGPQPGNVIRNALANKGCVSSCNNGGGGNDNGWTQVGGAARQITVDNAGKPWVVNSQGNLYVRTNNNWTYVRNNVQDAGASSRLSITNRQDRVFYKNTNNNSFNELGGRAEKVDVDNNANAWVVNSVNNVYQRSGNSWRFVTGKAIDIGSSGNNNAIYRVAPDRRIYKRNNNSWNVLSGSNGNRIDSDSKGRAWLVTTNGSLYRYNITSNKWVFIRAKVLDVGCGANGDVWVTLTDESIMKWNGNANATIAETTEIVETTLQFENRITVYPNPANERIYISGQDSTNPITAISIMDANGRIVKKISDFRAKDSQEISVSGIQAGIYFLLIKTQQEKTVKRLIIN